MLKFKLLLFLMVLLLVGCVSNEDIISDNNSYHIETRQSKRTYNGKEVVSAIFFGVGDFCNEISSLQKYSSILESSPLEMKNKYFEVVSNILDEIEIQNSNLFIVFKETLVSGDPVLVEEELVGIGREIQDFLKSKIEIDSINQFDYANSIHNINELETALNNMDYTNVEIELNKSQDEILLEFGDFTSNDPEVQGIFSAVLVFAVAIVAVYAAYFGVVASFVGGFTHYLGAFVDRWVEINYPIIGGGNDLELQMFVAELTNYFS